MNPKVRLLSWSPGLNKVRLVKLIRLAAAIPLDQAHDIVNRLLADEAAEVAFSSEEDANHFADQARELGVETERTEIKVEANR
jgi:hypothetical protein